MSFYSEGTFYPTVRVNFSFVSPVDLMAFCSWLPLVAGQKIVFVPNTKTGQKPAALILSLNKGITRVCFYIRRVEAV